MGQPNPWTTLRQRTMWHCPHSAAARLAAARRAAAEARPTAAAIDRYLLPAGPTAAIPPHVAAAGEWNRQTDGQTDGRTPDRSVDPASRILCRQCQ